MSFRKRNEPVGSLARPSPIARPGAGRPDMGRPAAAARVRKELPEADLLASNVGVRPSIVTSQPTVSTGCADLDRILVHQGLPLSNALLVEESGTTDFASVLLRAFAAQGVLHNRVDKARTHCHVVVVGASAAWAKDLPGPYKGSTKEQKKAKLAQDLSQISVSNMAERDLKIAWRYGINAGKPEEEEAATVYEHYVTQFDITQRLSPGASAQDMSFVPLGPTYTSVVAQVEKIVETHAKQGKVVRVVLPGFLNPSLYPPQWSSPAQVVPFLHSLRAVLAKHPSLALMASLPLELYPRDGLVTHMLETLMDGVVHLEPFNPDMAALIERAHKNEPAKIQQGLLHVIKVPLLSERGMMMVANGEYAFKNGRKKFEIEEWGIPVDDVEEPQQTTKNVDF